jgi:hypothetical protein
LRLSSNESHQFTRHSYTRASIIWLVISNTGFEIATLFILSCIQSGFRREGTERCKHVKGGDIRKDDRGVRRSPPSFPTAQSDMWDSGGILCIGGPALVIWVSPTEEELFKKFNPDLQKRALERRTERQEEFDTFVKQLKEYSKSDKPSMSVGIHCIPLFHTPRAWIRYQRRC